MKKIQDSIIRSLPPLKLYEDEIREVCEFFSQECGRACQIKTGGYSLDSPDELSVLPLRSTNSLSIECDNPYVHVDLWPNSGRIYVGDGSVLGEGIASRIESILAKGKVWMPSTGGKRWWLAHLSFTVLLWVGIFQRNLPLIALGVAWIVFGTLWMLIEGRQRLEHYNTITFSRRGASPGFWQRNKDEIGVTVIKVVLGAVLGFVSAWYLKG